MLVLELKTNKARVMPNAEVLYNHMLALEIMWGFLQTEVYTL